MAIFPGSAIPSAVSDYTIDQSLRFDGTSYLYRTPSSEGNLRTWTISFWTKLGDIVQYGNFINVTNYIKKITTLEIKIFKVLII